MNTNTNRRHAVSYHYSSREREQSETALPDIEVFFILEPDGEWHESGWYWWSCMPGYMPDGDAVGPFDTEAEAINDAKREDEL